MEVMLVAWLEVLPDLEGLEHGINVDNISLR
jgi:hypothetical protein